VCFCYVVIGSEDAGQVEWSQWTRGATEQHQQIAEELTWYFCEKHRQLKREELMRALTSAQRGIFSFTD
jgi:hypothetical protein